MNNASPFPVLAESASASESDASSPSQDRVRAWWFLVFLSIRRQARVRQMVWIALGLLCLTATLVALNTLAERWAMDHWRWRWVSSTRPVATVSSPGKPGAPSPTGFGSNIVFLTYRETADGLELLPSAAPWPAPALAIQTAIGTACRELLKQTDFYVFSNWLVFAIFVSFLLPIWSLSFATEALGGERENRSLIWLLTRPLPRSSIFLAKFVALLPWSFGLNVGGFALLCLLAGKPGQRALALYWPAVAGATLAFSALFHLMSACFRRAAVVALVYAFFLETVLGSMPGYMKRISIGFYTRCIMFEAGQNYGIQPEKPSIYLPVDSATAWCVLLSLTAVFLVVGTVVFARSQYQDLT
jgi:ABC-type transport system involved in multi-copper enzyme maturation permease subunit